MTTTTCPCRTRRSDPGHLVQLPCGCADVHYPDGTVCREHTHVECDGTPNGDTR